MGMGTIIKPDGEVVEIAEQDLRRIMSLARTGIQTERKMGWRMSRTTEHVERLLNGRLNF